MYFDKCHDLDTLKREYKRLCMLHHPDRGGDTRTMQDINAEYTRVFNRLKKAQNTAAETDDSVKHTDETPEDYRAIIEALLRVKGITIELVGSWLWVSGDTKPHKDELKAAGMFWSGKRRMWYWHPPQERKGRRFASRKSMDDIRATYGSVTFDTDAA